MLLLPLPQRELGERAGERGLPATEPTPALVGPILPVMPLHRALRLLASLSALSLALHAWADHGPAPLAQSAGSPIAGAPAPLEVPATVRLDAAEALIGLDADGYRATWKATLVNAGPPTRIRIGIPLRRLEHFLECGEGDTSPECSVLWYRHDLAGTPARLQLFVGRAQVPCRLQVPPGPRWPGEPPKDLLPWKPGPGPAQAEGWCVADGYLAGGSTTQLEARWEADLAFLDLWDGRDGTTSYGGRTLSLDLLSPGWKVAGHRGPLEVTVEAGRLAGWVQERPPALRWTGARGTRPLAWEGACGDGGAAGHLELSIDLDTVRHSEQLLASPGVRGAWEARASSTLPRQGTYGFSPKNVLDQDPATAWCEGAPGPGVGAWLELVYHPLPVGPGDLRLGFAGYVLVPGYAHSQAIWDANPRVRAFRLAPCDQPGAGVVVRLDGPQQPRLPSRVDASAILVPPIPDDPVEAVVLRWREEACVRLTILEITGGTAPDACIGEFRPILFHRPRPPDRD